MRTIVRLAEGSCFGVDDVQVRADSEAWFPSEVHLAYRLIFVRSGRFKLKVSGWEAVAHPVFAYLVRPGDEQRIAHRPGANDTCTSIMMSAGFLRDIVGDRLPAAARPMLTTGPVDLLHRTLVARARANADEFELYERVSRLAAATLAPLRVAGLRGDGGRPRRSAARLADAARELVADNPASLGLAEVARELGTSAPYLSRVFQEQVGVSLTRFRNQIRVRRVLDRIEAGERSLAVIAAELGFSDHAHMTRTVRDELGHPPALLRQMLRPEPVG
jgi:AraC-like DNA-binding protein